jgi:beta-hydroxylase
MAMPAVSGLREMRRAAARAVGIPAIKLADRLMVAGSKVPDTPVLDPGLFPWIPALETRWRDIRAELDKVLHYRELIPRFDEVSREQARIAGDGKWRTFNFFLTGTKFDFNCSLCPATTAALEAIPGMRTAFFSILAPGKHIPRHEGVSKGWLRCHLGLRIPRQRLRCHMDVGGVDFAWEEGKAVIFDDRFPHEVWNDTDEERTVLFIDIDRPMSFPASAMHRLMVFGVNRSAFITEARRNTWEWETRLRAQMGQETAEVS